MRDNLEETYLAPFVAAAKDLGLPICQGHGLKNCFDAGFGFGPKQQFQFGDLRVETDDRIVLIELESGGGLTNLVKYWPLACRTAKPMILLHVFAQSSEFDYVTHHCLWEFTWQKMSQDLERTAPGRLVARKFTLLYDDKDGWGNVVSSFRRYVTAPLDTVLQEA